MVMAITACVRLSTPSFCRMAETCALMVASDNVIASEQIYPFHIKDHVPALVEGRDKVRLKRLVARLGRLYPRKSKRFWQTQNSRYFGDIVHRVSHTGSTKFALLPPLSFYGSVGARNYARKLMPQRLKYLIP